MLFNPLFINTAGSNTDAAETVKQNKLNNATYLFSDIIKVCFEKTDSLKIQPIEEGSQIAEADAGNIFSLFLSQASPSNGSDNSMSGMDSTSILEMIKNLLVQGGEQTSNPLTNLNETNTDNASSQIKLSANDLLKFLSDLLQYFSLEADGKTDGKTKNTKSDIVKIISDQKEIQSEASLNEAILALLQANTPLVLNLNLNDKVVKIEIDKAGVNSLQGELLTGLNSENATSNNTSVIAAADVDLQTTIAEAQGDSNTVSKLTQNGSTLADNKAADNVLPTSSSGKVSLEGFTALTPQEKAVFELKLSLSQGAVSKNDQKEVVDSAKLAKAFTLDTAENKTAAMVKTTQDAPGTKSLIEAMNVANQGEEQLSSLDQKSLKELNSRFFSAFDKKILDAANLPKGKIDVQINQTGDSGTQQTGLKDLVTGKQLSLVDKINDKGVDHNNSSADANKNTNTKSNILKQKNINPSNNLTTDTVAKDSNEKAAEETLKLDLKNNGKTAEVKPGIAQKSQDNKSAGSSSNLDSKVVEDKSKPVGTDDSNKSATSDKKMFEEKFSFLQSAGNDEKISLTKEKMNFNSKLMQETFKTVKSADVMKEISSFIQKGDQKVIIFKIQPETLGKVKVTLDLVNKLVHANIEVENSQARQLVQNNLDYLKQSLLQSGVQLSAINVMLSNSEQKSTKTFEPKRKYQASGNNSKVEEKEDSTIARNLGYNTYEYLV